MSRYLTIILLALMGCGVEGVRDNDVTPIALGIYNETQTKTKLCSGDLGSHPSLSMVWEVKEEKLIYDIADDTYTSYAIYQIDPATSKEYLYATSFDGSSFLGSNIINDNGCAVFVWWSFNLTPTDNGFEGKVTTMIYPDGCGFKCKEEWSVVGVLKE